MPRQTHWANISELGASLGIAILLGAYKVGGNLLFKLFLAPVVAYFFLFNPRVRRASKDYLQRFADCFPQHQVSPSAANSFKHLWQFGLALIDKLAVWMGHITHKQVDTHGREIVDELDSKRQGAILLVSHLGNFEVSRAMARNFHTAKLTVLMHTKHAGNFNSYLQRYAHSEQMEVLQVTDFSPATAIMLSERVAKGNMIVISADRVPVSSPWNVAPVTFLGQETHFPVGAYLLASVLDVPVVALFCIKEAGRYQIYFEQFAERVQVDRKRRQEAFQQLAQAYADRLQHYCAKAPLQWFNFYFFWDQAPDGSKAEKYE
ncbi:MAG: hypothetical protein ACR2PJ_06210 [Pseudomonadales bacterium]